MTWINDLDDCASLGIINFDGPAYILGRQPRYYGNPNFETIPDMVLPMYPPSDVYQTNKPVKSKPNWKKIVTGVLLAGLAIFGLKKLGGARLFGKLGSKTKNFFNNSWSKIKSFKFPKVKNFKFSKVKTWFGNLGTKIKNTNLAKNIAKLFKKTP